MDGKTQYVPLAASVPLSEFPAGGIVRIPPTTVRAVDQNIAAVSQDGVYRTEEHLRQIQASRPAGIDPAEYVQSHVRRLATLRRARIVERVEQGIWRIPSDLPARGLDYDRQRTGSAEIRLVSPIPFERQRQAIGATCLDQQLIAVSGGQKARRSGDGARI